MSSIDSSSSPFASGDPTEISEAVIPKGTLWQMMESGIELGGERLNPILVKEARQALKSKQFVITFTLLLLAGWVWSMLGVALLSPGVYYAPGGRFMLSGYFIILTIPVLVIVPFSAFRSLAAEREDGTFELLSITALSSRQIVTGKLGSAMLQMLVYYSALAPCIAFTYLLRGIDIVTIVFLLFWTLVASVLLSSIGLVVATVSRARHWQVLLSVLLLVGLCFVTFFWTLSFVSLIVDAQATAFDDTDFWLAMAAIMTFCISHAVMFVLIAAAQISFASDNRSTKLRVMLLVQQTLWIGWMAFFWIKFEEEEILYILVSVACLYWAFAGACLMGEAAILSPRVKRSLPQSFLGRMCFTWFNPGSGTGYTFTVANLLTLLLVTIVAGLTAELEGFAAARGGFDWVIFVTLAVAYVIVYLGVARLVTLLLRQLGRVTMLLTFLVTLFLCVIGVALPLFFQAWLEGYSRMSYSIVQMSNWCWTLEEAADGNLLTFSLVPIIIYCSAVVVFFLNLLFAIYEVEQVRLATPERVLQDEREMHPSTDEKRGGSSPWDDLKAT
ncbi:MAG: hypothetical protein H6821_07145 [Planctomycetaceae bacterium]|nr:hypothetical protein [Planctomycetales bacterium]MCB9873941.1 hypothetical protein [Planctomycetaceae bacterium]MCB9938596.1 hypothetical protein [Planctomycetaceae bacterium]